MHSREIDGEVIRRHCLTEEILLEDSEPQMPVRKLSELMSKQVKCLTGFDYLKILLLYVIVICDGTLMTMTCTVSVLTWLEEWFLCLEFLWCHSTNRIMDYETIYQSKGKTIKSHFNKTVTDFINAHQMADVCIIC